jgi:hypothetical protein
MKSALIPAVGRAVVNPAYGRQLPSRSRATIMTIPVAVVVALTLLAYGGAGVSTANASPQNVASSTLAVVPITHGSTVAGLLDDVTVTLCVIEAPQPEVPCLFFSGAHFSFDPIDASAAGTTVWADSDTPGFNEFASRITDGVPNWLWIIFNECGCGTIRSYELAGFVIDRIGLRVDAIEITPDESAGRTLFRFQGAIVFEGRPKVAPPTSKDQCKNGGWQTFTDPSFKNEGDCVSFVATGGKNGGNG